MLLVNFQGPFEVNGLTKILCLNKKHMTLFLALTKIPLCFLHWVTSPKYNLPVMFDNIKVK